MRKKQSDATKHDKTAFPISVAEMQTLLLRLGYTHAREHAGGILHHAQGIQKAVKLLALNDTKSFTKKLAALRKWGLRG